MAISKRLKALLAKVDRARTYPLDDALKLVKETSSAKFNESVDVAINLGIDARKSDQLVRGSIVLPKAPVNRCAWRCLPKARQLKRPKKRARRSLF